MTCGDCMKCGSRPMACANPTCQFCRPMSRKEQLAMRVAHVKWNGTVESIEVHETIMKCGPHGKNIKMYFCERCWTMIDILRGTMNPKPF